jgi:hypothetical protein
VNGGRATAAGKAAEKPALDPTRKPPRGRSQYNVQNLKPFRAGPDPRRNTAGINQYTDPLNRLLHTKLIEGDGAQDRLDKIAEVVIAFAMAGSPEHLKILFDRLVGKVPVRQEIGGPGAFSNPYMEYSLEDLNRISKELEEIESKVRRVYGGDDDDEDDDS